MTGLLSVFWDVDPAFITIGSFDIRYYGITWAIAFAIGILFFSNFVKREKLPMKVLDSIIWYGAISTIVGARLGHILAYEPLSFWAEPWQFFNIRQGGLASHGAALGLLLGLWLFSKRKKLPYVWSLDRIMIPVTLGGAFVRFGNLMNSEIYGIETDLPWGFIFTRVGETVPKHPTQIYEALCYIITFAVLVWLYYGRDEGRKRRGVMFGVGLIGVFLSRFFIEYIKNPQSAFEQDMFLFMGQWLSIPFVLLGIFIIVWAYRRPVVHDKPSAGKPASKENSKAAAAANIVAASEGKSPAAQGDKNKKR